MPQPLASTQRVQALALLKQRGITRLAELRSAGVTGTTVSRMERPGEIVRLARGLYQLPDAALDPQQSLAEAARLVPKGVICLASALACHGLTDQMPPKVWIAIGRKDWRPRITYPPLRVARFSEDELRRGRPTCAAAQGDACTARPRGAGRRRMAHDAALPDGADQRCLTSCNGGAWMARARGRH